MRKLLSKNWRRLPGVQVLRHVYSSNPSFYCLVRIEQDNCPLVFPARWSRQSWLESPLSEPSGWHIKLLPMSEIVGWPRNQAAGDLESSSWPNWPSKKAGQDVLESQTFRAARDLQQGQNVQTLTQSQSLKWCTWNIELGWGKSVTQTLVFVKAHLKNMLGKEVIIPT